MKIYNYVAILLSFIFVIACGKSENSYVDGVKVKHLENRIFVDADSIKGIIFQADYEYNYGGNIHSMKDMIPFRVFEVWDPKINDIKYLEQSLYKYWSNEQEESEIQISSIFDEAWEKLFISNGRQYVGYKNQDGEKYIWAILFKIIDEPIEDWKRHIIEPTGVTPVLIEVHFNVEKNEIEHVGGY